MPKTFCWPWPIYSIYRSQTQDLTACLNETNYALKLFLINKYAEAKNRMEPG